MEELKAQVIAFKHTVRLATEVETMIETAELIWCCKRWRATIMKWHCRTAITANRHVAADEHLRAKLMKRYLCYLWKVIHTSPRDILYLCITYPLTYSLSLLVMTQNRLRHRRKRRHILQFGLRQLCIGLDTGLIQT